MNPHADSSAACFCPDNLDPVVIPAILFLLSIAFIELFCRQRQTDRDLRLVCRCLDRALLYQERANQRQEKVIEDLVRLVRRH